MHVTNSKHSFTENIRCKNKRIFYLINKIDLVIYLYLFKNTVNAIKKYKDRLKYKRENKTKRNTLLNIEGKKSKLKLKQNKTKQNKKNNTNTNTKKKEKILEV